MINNKHANVCSSLQNRCWARLPPPPLLLLVCCCCYHNYFYYYYDYDYDYCCHTIGLGVTGQPQNILLLFFRIDAGPAAHHYH